jgi:hypothetical protein
MMFKKTFGNLTLQRVHQAPNIYIIDNFLRPSEIAYLKQKYIQHGRFQRSYVDAIVPAVSVPVPVAVVSQEEEENDDSDNDNNNNSHGNTITAAADQKDDSSRRTTTTQDAENPINNNNITQSAAKLKSKSAATTTTTTSTTATTTTTTKTLYDNQHRTSTFLSFNKQHDAKIAAIEQRAANLLGCWSSQCIEPLQVCLPYVCMYVCMPHAGCTKKTMKYE